MECLNALLYLQDTSIFFTSNFYATAVKKILYPPQWEAVGSTNVSSQGEGWGSSDSKVNCPSLPLVSHFSANAAGLFSVRMGVVLPGRHERETYPPSQCYQGPVLILAPKFF